MTRCESWKRRGTMLAALVAGCLSISAAPPEQPGPVLKAMETELQRAMTGLAREPAPPYYLAYTVTDRETASVSASNGALHDTSRNHVRLLDVAVRVGSYDTDNTHRIQGDRWHSYMTSYSSSRQLPVEDDVDALRAAIWLQTDETAKSASEEYTQVRTNRAVSVKEEDTSADFSREKPERSISSPARLDADSTSWERRARELSRLFTVTPEIYTSSVVLRGEAVTSRLVSSEGATLQQGRTSYRLGVWAATKADDGMDLYRYESWDVASTDRLPDDATVRRAAAAMVADLLALRAAPVVEPYTGPAILEGKAAGVFFHEIFGHRIEGHRQKDEEEGQTFTKKVNEQVLPTFLSVVDDPTLARLGGIDLNGHYAFDNEGVAARRVSVVDNGILKGFLMSRSPITGFASSNGHGRGAPGYRPVGRQGNLIVTARETVSEARLRELLRAEVTRQGKPFGLLFRDISGGYTSTGRGSPQAYQVEPLVVYRVYADGRPDQLVRGADIIGTPLASFSEILAASDRTEVFNGYCGAESGWVPVSAVAPSILTAKIEIQKREKSSARPPLLPPPGKESVQ